MVGGASWVLGTLNPKGVPADPTRAGCISPDRAAAADAGTFWAGETGSALLAGPDLDCTFAWALALGGAATTSASDRAEPGLLCQLTTPMQVARAAVVSRIMKVRERMDLRMVEQYQICGGEVENLYNAINPNLRR